jgi:hypothetical protein
VGNEKLALSISMLVFIILLISIFWIFPLIISEPPRGIRGIADYFDVLILPDAEDKSEATMKIKLKIKGDMERANFIIGSAGKELTSGEIMALNIAKGEFRPPPIYLGDLRKGEEYEFDFRVKISNEYEWADFDLHEVYIVGRYDRPVFFGFYKARYTGFVKGIIKLVSNPEIFNNASDLRMKR